MCNVLLTHAYFLDEDEKERSIMKPYPPLGLLYVSAYLRRAGFDAEVFDSTFSDRESLLARLQSGPPGVIGIYTNLLTRRTALDIVAAAKAGGWTVVLGGPESANYPQQYLDHGGDVVVVGEGEVTMAELLPALSRSGPHRLHGVLGTVFRDEDGQIVSNPPRPQIADIDSLPWPDREQIDQPRYVDVWREHHGAGSVNLITAHRCPYKCRWCSHAVFGYTHRRRDYRDCADELQHIRQTYRPDQVWYADDVFTISHAWLHKYAAELERRDLHLPFETISRADRMRKTEVLETLAKMGCRRIWIGSESGSQRVLDAMQRGVTVEQVQWVCREIKRFGIQVGMFLMWGYPGETLNDIAATVEHVKTCDPDVFFTTVAYPIKNTGYFEEIAGEVSLDKPWADATDRDYLVPSRQSHEFYRQATDWLNNEVAASRLEIVDAEAAEPKRAAARRARASMQRELDATADLCETSRP